MGNFFKTIIELAKASGVQLAKMIAIEKVTELAVNAVNNNALSGLGQKIANKIAGSVTPALISNNGILLSAYSRLEQDGNKRT